MLHFSGENLVPRKLIEVCERMAPENVKHISFGEFPNIEDYGRWYPEASTIMINLSNIISYAAAEMQLMTNGLSYRAILWASMLGTVAHEFCHAKQNNPDSPAAEAEAKEVERTAPFVWAKYIDLELPLNWGGLIDEILAMEASWDETSTHPWEQTQIACLKGGLLWFDRTSKSYKLSYKQLARDTIHDGDPKWDEVLGDRSVGLDMVDEPAMAAVAAAAITEPLEEIQPPPPPQPQGVNIPGFNVVMPGAPTMAAATPAPQPQIADNDVMGYIDDEEDFGNPPPQIETSSIVTPVMTPPQMRPAIVPQQPVTQAAPAVVTDPSLEARKAAAIQEILRRVHEHLYEKCGWQPGADRPFANAGVVTEPVFIGDIPHYREVIVGFDCVNGWGQAVVFNGPGKMDILQLLEKGLISGTISSKQGLPMYTFYVNIGGVMCKRTVLPANPNKMDPKNPGQLSKWAQEARQGVRRTAIYAPDSDPVKQGGGITSVVEQAPGGPAIWRKW